MNTKSIKCALFFIANAVITGIGFQYLFVPVIFGGIAGLLVSIMWFAEIDWGNN